MRWLVVLALVAGSHLAVAGFAAGGVRVAADEALKCDVDGDGDVDSVDVNLVRGALGVLVEPGDPRDADSDGRVTTTDVRQCTLLCTRASCAV